MNELYFLATVTSETFGEYDSDSQHNDSIDSECDNCFSDGEYSTSRTSSKPKPFKCSEEGCNKEFTLKRNLADHHKSHHEGVKPHVCNYEGCGKSFLRPAHLVIHMRIHTGEKPFECPFEGCGKRWNQKSALKQHIRSHTGEKPYNCPEKGCGKTFSTSSSCKRHQQTHNKKRKINDEYIQEVPESEMIGKKLRTSSSSENLGDHASDLDAILDSECSNGEMSPQLSPAREVEKPSKMGLNFLLN